MTRSIFTILLPLLYMLLRSASFAESLPIASSKSIGITIMGTIVSKTTGRNVVLVKESESGKVQAYREGHAISEKYRIVEISKQYIVVLKDQVKTKVYQDKFAGKALAEGKGGKSNQPKFAENFSEDGFERKGGKIKMTAAYRDKIVQKDMAKILMQATAQPYMKDGVVKGFQLSQIDPDSIFDKGGFRDLDIVTAINGIELNSAAGAISLLKKLKNATSIDIVIERDGVEQDMTLSID